MIDYLADLTTPIAMGILLGGLYAVIALGLSLVFGVMKLINVAHGDLVILGSYMAYAILTALGIDPIIGLAIGIPIFFLFGFGIQKYLLNRAFHVSMEAPLIIAFGLSIIIQNFVQLVWSPLSRGLTTSYSLASVGAGPLHLPLVYVIDFAAALVVMLILSEFLKRTYLGKAINASSQDSRAAQLMGINTERMYAFAFAIAMAITAIGGVFLGLTFPFTPQSGVSFLVVAFGVVILGGLGSILGSFVGGIILGLAQTLSAYYFGAATQMLAVYVIVFIILAARPQGIFGR